MVIWTGYTLCFFTVFPNYEYLYRKLNRRWIGTLLDTLVWMDGIWTYVYTQLTQMTHDTNLCHFDTYFEGRGSKRSRREFLLYNYDYTCIQYPNC